MVSPLLELERGEEIYMPRCYEAHTLIHCRETFGCSRAAMEVLSPLASETVTLSDRTELSLFFFPQMPVIMMPYDHWQCWEFWLLLEPSAKRSGACWYGSPESSCDCLELKIWDLSLQE